MTPDQILALEREATQGEWYEAETRHPKIFDICWSEVGEVVCGEIQKHDADFFIAMHTHIVALCEVAKAAEDFMNCTTDYLAMRSPEGQDMYAHFENKLDEALAKLKAE